MSSNWLGLLELFIVLGLGLGIAVIELVGLRLDRKKREAEAAAQRAAKPDAPAARDEHNAGD